MAALTNIGCMLEHKALYDPQHPNANFKKGSLLTEKYTFSVGGAR